MVAAVAAGAADQPSAGKGELAFNNHCRTCHSIKPDDHRQGPSLHGIVGAEAGSTGYAAYSEGMKNSDVTWDEPTLDKFIENPDQVIPNNKMKPYTGLTDEGVRQQIVDFLESRGKSE
jgi:cytochrome c